MQTDAGLVQVLSHYQLVSELDLQQALVSARAQQQSLLHCLVQQKFLSATVIAKCCAEYYKFKFMDINHYPLTHLPENFINEEFIKQYPILPIMMMDDQVLQVAICDPDHLPRLRDIQFQTGLLVQGVFVDYEQLHQVINRYLSRKSYNLITQEMNGEYTTMPVVNFVEQILTDAIHQGASDIHCEPLENQFRIRMRIDGLLHEITQAPIHLCHGIASRLKIMAKLDIAERRLPQDGRFAFTTSSGLNRDCRLSTCPTLFGEKIVIRLLESTGRLLDINELGFEEQAKQYFLTAIEQPQGMVIVTGPTGSGKTLTLYTALQHLNVSIRNIITIEDPIEIQLAGINQVNLNEKAGLDFSTALRAFLRQDPDVIMVGEVRDQATAAIAIRAAQTGHLVLSTLHANSAQDTLIRLTNMGIASFNLTNAVTLVVAQRLLRKLCQYCRQEHCIPEKTLRKIGLIPVSEKTQQYTFYRAQGCEHCLMGYRGRIGVFEVLPMLSPSSSNKQIPSLWQAALKKVQLGLASLSEVYRVVKQETQ